MDLRCVPIGLATELQEMEFGLERLCEAFGGGLVPAAGMVVLGQRPRDRLPEHHQDLDLRTGKGQGARGVESA
jgi:hypothetical protein